MDADLPNETTAELERVERDAWLDLYAAAPAATRQRLGIDQRVIGDGALLVFRALDHMQFNRVSNLGVAEPARAETFDQAVTAFDAAGGENRIVHVAPPVSHALSLLPAPHAAAGRRPRRVRTAGRRTACAPAA